MKKLLVLLMVVGLLAGALSVESSAKKKKKKKAKPVVKVTRTETAEYSAPGYLTVGTVTGNVCAEGTTACIVFPAQQGEKYVSVEVIDDSGTPSPVSVSLGESSTVYCGKTTAPVLFTGFTEVGVHVGTEAPPTCQGVATAGQVKVTFSNLP